MKTYKITLKINTSDWQPPDWIIAEIRDLLVKTKDEMPFISLEQVDE